MVGNQATGTELTAELHRTARDVVAYGLDRIDPERDIRIVLIEAGDRSSPACPIAASVKSRFLQPRSGTHRCSGLCSTSASAGSRLPREMIPAYAILKRSAAVANRAPLRLPNSGNRTAGF